MTEPKKYSWHKIAESREDLHFNGTDLLQLEANGKNICLIKKDKELAACTAKCPHAGGILADGYLDALGNIVCPLHRYRFNPQNGRNTSGEGYFLKIFPVNINEEGVFVGFEI